MLDNANARAVAASVVDPIARFFLRIGLTPNMVTFFTSAAVSTIVLLTWSRGQFGLGLALCAPMVFGDLLDGTMARLSGLTSKWGSFLDSVMDRVTDASILIALELYSFSVDQANYIAAAAVSLATGALIPYIRAKAESIGVECKVGLMERSERLFMMLLAGIAGASGFTAGIGYALYLLAALNVFTVFQRMNAVRKSVGQ
jgi:CDP-diacylglycerol--glycerol-3-phosphate 3-phosphatidyltransferase